MKITRRIEFDAGHRLLNHEGKCAYLHGHRYAAEITIGGDLDAVGRVIDFSHVKGIIGEWIDANWDHNLLLHPNDPLWQVDMMTLCYNGTDRGKQPFALYDSMGEPVNPTAENMAAFLYFKALELLPRNDNTYVDYVRLYETPNCWAVYSGE